MPLLDDLHHLAFLTADMDRLIGFYTRVFEAEVKLDVEEEGLRHALIAVGPQTLLHPFQIPGIEPPGPQPMFERGRLDHFGLNAADEASLREIRRRIVAESAGDGVVTDLGALLSTTFTDPDGGEHEVVLVKPGVPLEASLRRTWKTIEMD